jgi:hypothetical protein
MGRPAAEIPGTAAYLEREARILEYHLAERRRAEAAQADVERLRRELEAAGAEPVAIHGKLTAARIFAAIDAVVARPAKPTRAIVAEELSTVEMPVSMETLDRARVDLRLEGWPPRRK